MCMVANEKLEEKIKPVISVQLPRRGNKIPGVKMFSTKQ